MKTFKRAIFVPLLFLAAIAASLAVFAQPAQSQTSDVLASDVVADSPQNETALAASDTEDPDHPAMWIIIGIGWLLGMIGIAGIAARWIGG